MNYFIRYNINIEEKEQVISKIGSKLFEKEEIIFAYIYGSFIESNFRDIDIGVYLDENIIQMNKYLDYSLELSLELETTIKKYPLDVIIINYAPLSLVFRITQGKLLFIKDENFWVDYVTKVWSLYHDHSITSRNILKDIITA